MTKSLAHVSVKPWGEITKADYTPEQWHTACLIHQHSGAPTSKDQCKLPVKTPNGSVNRNGVHAAAAALAGARGGVDASDAEKASAKKALLRLYAELGEDPPDSLTHSDVIEHYGVKGMKWGRRKEENSEPKTPVEIQTHLTPGKRVATSGGAYHSPHEDAIKAAVARQKIKASTLDSLSNKELKTAVDRMGLEQRYVQLLTTQPKTAKQKAIEMAKSFIFEMGHEPTAEFAGAKYGVLGEIAVDTMIGSIRNQKPEDIMKRSQTRQERRDKAARQQKNG